MAKFLFLSFFLLNFATWIGWSSYHPIRGKSVAPSIISMTDIIKSTDKMGKKRPLTDIKDAFKKLWGDRYNYDLITEENYIDTHHKVPIVCKEHGIFYQEPKVHLKGHGCPVCAGCAKMSNEEFVRRAIEIWGDKYDYSLVDLKNANFKVKIICQKHGVFEQVASSHLCGHGCPSCAGVKEKTTDEFIVNARKIHGNKYDYSNVIYINAKEKVKIKCLECGQYFEQTPNSHLSGQGCPTCGIKHRNQKITLPLDVWIERSKKTHSIEYDYSRVHFNRVLEKVWIKCPNHGWFLQEAKAHMNGDNCPLCSCVSKGEEMIAFFLDENGVDYVRQHKVANENLFCKNTNLLIDFYVPSFNLFIEYNGRQHYEPVERFGGQDAYMKQKERDIALKQYCKKHNIRLVEIPYTEYRNIEDIIKKELKI